MTNKQKQHPTVQRAYNRATELKLDRRTVADLIRSTEEQKRWNPKFSLFSASTVKATFVPRDKRWSRDQRDARRVKVDSRFRKSETAKLKRQYGKLWTCPDSEFLTALSAYQKRQKALNIGTPVTPKKVNISDTTATRVGYNPDRRGKDWSVNATLRESYRVYEPGETKWSGGRPKSYTRATHATFVRSIAIASGTTVRGVAHQTLYSIPAPDGTFWATDQNGVKLVLSDSRQDDYHPTAADMLAGPVAIMTALRRNQATRREMAAKAAVEAAELEGVYVGMRDSLRAGNCAGGSASFCERHGLDPRKHYTAPELLAIANGDASRVRLAVTAATIRHRADMVRGYSEIEYFADGKRK